MFLCDCDVGWDGGDNPSPFSEIVRTARKEYRCVKCRRPIRPGDQYEFTRGKWDDHWSTYRTCMVCHAIKRDMLRCGWTYGSLWEDLRETYREGFDDDTEWLCPSSPASNH